MPVAQATGLWGQEPQALRADTPVNVSAFQAFGNYTSNPGPHSLVITHVSVVPSRLVRLEQTF